MDFTMWLIYSML
jgi:hypothetical protein